MPSFLRMCDALTSAYQEGDVDLVKELASENKSHLLLLSDVDRILFDSKDDRADFRDAYEMFCRHYKLPFNESDLTFGSLASHGIIKCWDFARDKMCVLGFASVPLSDHSWAPQSPVPAPPAGDQGIKRKRPRYHHMHPAITKEPSEAERIALACIY